jgi:ATP-dependent Clp protease ATP-binding subunit ClpA
VLFGKLKNGGHVRVVVAKEEGDQDSADHNNAAASEKLGFEFLDGPVTPKPEKIPPVRPKNKRRGGGGGSGSKRAKPPGPRGDGGAPPPSRGSVPKIPLVKV